MTTLSEIARVVADQLGWQVKSQEGNYITLKGEGEREIGLILDSYKDRINIYGHLSSYKGQSMIPYGKQAPKITVAATRSPMAIAKDIERRFMPEYQELYLQCMETKRKYTELDSQIAQNLAMFGKILCVSPKENSLLYYKGCFAEFTPSGNNCTITLRSVSMDKALRIAQVLAE